MNCGSVQQRLTLFLLGDLDAAESGRIEAHLAACDVCRAHVQDLKTTLDLLGGALADAKAGADWALSREARLRVMATRPGTLPSWSWVFERHPRLALAASVVAVAGLTWGIVANLRPVRPAAVAAQRTPTGRLVGERVLDAATDKWVVPNGADQSGAVARGEDARKAIDAHGLKFDRVATVTGEPPAPRSETREILDGTTRFKAAANAAEESKRRAPVDRAPAVPLARQPAAPPEPDASTFVDLNVVPQRAPVAAAAERADGVTRLAEAGGVVRATAIGGTAGGGGASSAGRLDPAVAATESPARTTPGLVARDSALNALSEPGLHAVDPGSRRPEAPFEGRTASRLAVDDVLRQEAAVGLEVREAGLRKGAAAPADALALAPAAPPALDAPSAPAAPKPVPSAATRTVPSPVESVRAGEPNGAPREMRGVRSRSRDDRADADAAPRKEAAAASGPEADPSVVAAAALAAAGNNMNLGHFASGQRGGGSSTAAPAVAAPGGVGDVALSASVEKEEKDQLVPSATPARVEAPPPGYEAVRRSLAQQVWPPRDVVNEGVLQSAFQRDSSRDRVAIEAVARLEELLRRGPFGARVEDLDTIADELEALAQSRGGDSRLTDLARMARSAAALMRGK